MSQTLTIDNYSWLNFQRLSTFVSGVNDKTRGDESERITKAIPANWQERIPALFGAYFWHGFSEPHEALFDWCNGIQADNGVRPFVAIWPRGRGKSTVAETITADCGVRQARQYVMYVSGTQEQADKHVQTIARMLELDTVAQYAADLGKPRMSKNGNRQWNRQILQTASGYTVEAVGLNKAVRGQKIDWARPDLIVMDDVDERHDSELTTRKKQEIITSSILPAGAPNVAVLFVQNLIHSDSIAARLARKPGSDGAADYLMDRQISGPFPAVDGLEYELQQRGELYRWAITTGTSLWAGFDIAICEDEINRDGPTAYLLESQHEVDADSPAALLASDDFERTRTATHPDLARVAVAVDPPGGATECGIVVGGKARVGGEWHGYTLEDASTEAGAKPEQWARAVLSAYYRHKADVVFVERNFGGDMAASTLRQVKLTDATGAVLLDGSQIHIVEVTASRGKAVRAEPVAAVFQQGRGHHVGRFDRLEKEWRQWTPGDSASPNRLDAETWLYTGLELTGGGWLI